MRFNLKYLVFPLSIIGCINNNCINAMEPGNTNTSSINKNRISFDYIRGAMNSFLEDEELNEIQIDFIKRIANEISKHSDIKTWHNLLEKQKKYYNHLDFSSDNFDFDLFFDDEYNQVLDNTSLLFYLSYENYLNLPKCYAEEHKYKEFGYLTLIERIKQCYEENYINKKSYILLLQYLIYCNSYQILKCKIEFDSIEEDDSNCVRKIFEVNNNINVVVINRIIDYLIQPLLPKSRKIQEITADIMLNNIKSQILDAIVQGIYDNFPGYMNDCLNEADNKIIRNLVDSEFHITERIKLSPEYKDYEENFNQFKQYYHLLRRKSSKDQDSNKTQYQSFEDVKNKIKTKDFNVSTNKNSGNSNPMPENIYSKILPYLVHTKFDHKPNNNTVNKINKDSD